MVVVVAVAWCWWCWWREVNGGGLDGNRGFAVVVLVVRMDPVMPVVAAFGGQDG